jgi:predicted Ser/Thr protein kinase
MRFQKVNYGVLKFEQLVQKCWSIFHFQVRIIVEDTMQTDATAIADELKKRGYSEKTIENILKWYGFVTEKAAQKRPVE